MNITKHDDDKKLKKANHEIGFTLESGEMNFVTRKIYNALIYHSQRLGLKKKGVLPFDFDWDLSSLPKGIEVNNYFWIPLGELIGDASVKREYDLIRGFLNDMKRILVSRSVPGVWEQVSNILGDVVYLNSNTLKKTARDKWAIGWNFPVALEPLLLDPEQYTPISLYYQSFLSSETALVLYETARRYAGWSEHRTPKLPWKEWQLLLTGDKERRAEYRFFKRDFLKEALLEINQSTDVEIDLLEFRKGTKVIDIRFDVALKAQKKLELPAGPAINTKILDDLKAAGVADAVAERLISDFSEDQCANNLALYKKTGAGKTVGWLVKAIKDNYSAGVIAAAEGEKLAAAEKTAVVAGKQKAVIEDLALSALPSLAADNAARHAREALRAAFDALPVDVRTALVDEYLDTLKGSPAKSARATLARPNWLSVDPDGKKFLAWFGAKQATAETASQ